MISCWLERARIGVAGDARKRLRELQVGSPVELKLAHAQRYPDRRDAEAVAEELYRYFAGRRVRGSWYRLTVADVREALGRPATLEAPAHAQARARAAAEAAAQEDPPAPRRGGRVRARTQKQLAYERRRRQERTRKQKRAAKLLGQRMTQEQAALELAVTSRTLRNWKTAPRESGRSQRIALFKLGLALRAIWYVVVRGGATPKSVFITGNGEGPPHWRGGRSTLATGI